VDEDAEMACWYQLELEEREQFEREQKLLLEDSAYEKWLEQLENDDGFNSERQWRQRLQESSAGNPHSCL